MKRARHQCAAIAPIVNNIYYWRYCSNATTCLLCSSVLKMAVFAKVSKLQARPSTALVSSNVYRYWTQTAGGLQEHASCCAYSKQYMPDAGQYQTSRTIARLKHVSRMTKQAGKLAQHASCKNPTTRLCPLVTSASIRSEVKACNCLPCWPTVNIGAVHRMQLAGSDEQNIVLSGPTA